MRRKAQEVIDDQVEALALEPVEGLQHRLRGSVYPSFVHVHGREVAEEGAVRRGGAAGVIGHRVVGRVEMQAKASCQAAGDGGLARAAPAADPVDVPEPFAKLQQVMFADLAHGLRRASEVAVRGYPMILLMVRH